jgi:hypothetical protein
MFSVGRPTEQAEADRRDESTEKAVRKSTLNVYKRRLRISIPSLPQLCLCLQPQQVIEIFHDQPQHNLKGNLDITPVQARRVSSTDKQMGKTLYQHRSFALYYGLSLYLFLFFTGTPWNSGH